MEANEINFFETGNFVKDGYWIQVVGLLGKHSRANRMYIKKQDVYHIGKEVNNKFISDREIGVHEISDLDLKDLFKKEITNDLLNEIR